MGMSNIRAALETALSSMTPALAVAWENMPFTPVTGTPYQRASIILAEPANDEIGRTFNERGVFQVSLHYPPNAGPSAAYARADLIRDKFYRGQDFTSGGVTVHVIGTPSILPPTNDDQGRYALVVSINFRASAQS